MIRNLKAVGLTLIVVFAVSAMAASSAWAANDHFTTTKEKALLTGVGTDNGFHYPNGVGYECATARLTGTFLNNSTEMTIDPTYTGQFGEPTHNTEHQCGKIAIDMNACHYVLTGNTTGVDEGSTDGTVWITCPGTNVLKITQSGFGITIQIPPQTPTTGGVTYTNQEENGKKVIRLQITMTGITSLCHPAFICGLVGFSTHENNTTFTGTAVLTGYEDLDGLPTPITEGTQIPIEVSST